MKTNVVQTKCIITLLFPNWILFLFPLLVADIINHPVTKVRKLDSSQIFLIYPTTTDQSIIKSYSGGLLAIYYIMLSSTLPPPELAQDSPSLTTLLTSRLVTLPFILFLVFFPFSFFFTLPNIHALNRCQID